MKRSSWKSLVSLLCVLALVIGMIPGVRATEQETFTYEKNADGSLTLTGYIGAEGNLTVPAQLDGYPVTAIGDGCFRGKLCLRRVHIPEGIRTVGAYAFECCSALEKVYFPDSLQTIGDGAFSGCGRLYLADLGDGLERIGAGAFLCCDALVQLELPAALEELGAFAFGDCQSLASVRFRGDALTVLPDRVFTGCTALARLRLPEGITAIGKRAFYHCESLTSLYFGEPLTALGAYAFEGCSRLSSIHFSAEVLPTGLFKGCESLTWFSVAEGTRRIARGAFANAGITDVSLPASLEELESGALYGVAGSVYLEENPNYKLVEGSLYTADGKTLVAYFPADPYAEEPQTRFTVPQGVEVLGAYALCERFLTEVTLPRSLKRIEAHALEGNDLEGLEIPEGVEVDPEAFGPVEPTEDPGQEEPGEEIPPEVIGSVAGEKNLFKPEDWTNFHEVANQDFAAWCRDYLAFNEANGNPMEPETIPYILRYKGEVVPHYMAMTAVQNHDPGMWADAANQFGDDFEQMYLMMDHGLFTELGRGRMDDDLILYSGLYDSQLMAAAGTETVPTQQQLVDAIGTTFSDPIMISTTTDPAVACGFGDTLFVIYASRKAMEALGAVCIDAVTASSEKEILMNNNARYRILDVGNLAVETQEPWEEEPTVLYRGYVKVELLAPETPKQRFEDVPEGAYYRDAVDWAVENGVTKGVDETHFAPEAQASRGEAVTFLWRAAGSPKPANPANPFTDVKKGYYRDAVLWAVEQGVTKGATETTFEPGKPCTRGEIVTFLWRAAGSPKPANPANPFTDVKKGYYRDAVLWAVEQGVTKGVTATTFNPDGICTRAEAVTFLYRAR